MGKTTKQQWNFFEAQSLIAKMNQRVLPVGYAIGLTGGVLFNGYSNNDLDLILYPLTDHKTPYDKAVRCLLSVLTDSHKLYISNREKHEKLVFVVLFENGRRIDLFIPSFSMSQREDSLPAQIILQEIPLS